MTRLPQTIGTETETIDNIITSSKRLVDCFLIFGPTMAKNFIEMRDTFENKDMEMVVGLRKQYCAGLFEQVRDRSAAEASRFDSNHAIGQLFDRFHSISVAMIDQTGKRERYLPPLQSQTFDKVNANDDSAKELVAIIKRLAAVPQGSGFDSAMTSMLNQAINT